MGDFSTRDFSTRDFSTNTHATKLTQGNSHRGTHTGELIHGFFQQIDIHETLILICTQRNIHEMIRKYADDTRKSMDEKIHIIQDI